MSRPAITFMTAPAMARTGALPFSVEVLTGADSLAAIAREIDSLTRVAIEPNVFYEAWMLEPALEFLQPEGVRIVVVRNDSGHITGFFPFRIRNNLHGLPIRNLQSLHHDYCFLHTPLISSHHAQQTLETLLDWLASSAAPAKTLELIDVTADGDFSQMLKASLATRPQWKIHTEVRERALFIPQRSQDPGVSGKHLRKLRGLERRLAERGALVYRSLNDDEAIKPWLDRFLELEASGWKGRNGTALASDARSRQFFHRIAEAARQRLRIQMLALELDGTAIAMRCGFLAGAGAFTFKIAHDERYGKYSPGVLLELHNMEQLTSAKPDVAWMDSCTRSQNFMFNRLWTDRRVLADHVLANRSIGGRLFVRYWPQLKAARKLVGRLVARE